MHYTVYRTTNLINGKTYIGVHATEDPNDPYLGSGQVLKAAIRKHGKAAFRKEILFVFDNPKAMSDKESELVTRDFVDREDTYNLVPGGKQGDSWYQSRKGMVYLSEVQSERGKKGNAATRRLWDTSPEWRKRYQSALSVAQKRKGNQKHATFNFEGRRHSEETLQKMRASAAGREGEKNPSFGTKWVCSPSGEQRKIPASELQQYLTAGWKRGRGRL